MAADDKPLSELEREAENSRAQLMHTVDSLQSRVSGRAIKEDIKEFVRDTRDSMIHTIERRIRENPLQAAAIVVGLAYPIWRIVSHLPAPIALIGAGIALTQGGSRSAYSNGSHGSRPTAATELTNSARAKMHALGEEAADTVDRAVHAAENMASQSVEAASDALSQAYQAGADLAEKASLEVEETLHWTQDSLIRAVHDHPLAAGAVGLLVGGFFASCIPSTAAENEAFGQLSDVLKEQARDIVDEGVGAITAAAGEIYEHTAAATQRDGLTPEVVRDTVREVGAQVRTGAQKLTEQLDQASRNTTSSGEANG